MSQVLTDSVQFGDREAFDPTLGQFSNFNEPYYQKYINTDIGEPNLTFFTDSPCEYWGAYL